MIPESEIQAILDRDDAIRKHAQKIRCPNCDSEQLQIMDKATPAKWRCRMCLTRFTSEPDE